jgi:hypothetical protein
VHYTHFFLLLLNLWHHGSGGTAVKETHIFHPVKVSNYSLAWFSNYAAYLLKKIDQGDELGCLDKVELTNWDAIAAAVCSRTFVV